MSGVGLPTGEAFWGPRFGIGSEAEFEDDLEASILGGGPPGITVGVQHVFAELAWHDPYGGPGIAAQAALKLQGFPQPLPPAAGSVLNQVLSSAIASIQGIKLAGIVVPNAFQVTISHLCGGRPVDNVIGVLNAGGSAQGAADAVKFAWENAGGPLGPLPAALEVQSYTAVDLSSPTGDIAIDSSTATGGDSTHDIATRGACALWKWNGGSRSRSVRGRMYLGPLTENLIDSDGVSLTSTAITGLTGNMTQFLTNLSGESYPLCVISRKLQVATTITTKVLETEIATQRRRIRG